MTIKNPQLHRVCVANFTAAALGQQPVHSVAAATDNVSRVMMVGALMNAGANGANVLRENDDRYLAAVVKAGPQLGVRFAKDVDVRVCNIRMGGDFLAAAQGIGDDARADMVVFCYVYYNQRGSSDRIDRTLYTQSERAFVDGAWHAALMATQAARAVNIYATGEELPTELLVRDPFMLSHKQMQCTGGKVMDVLARRDLVSRLVAA